MDRITAIADAPPALRLRALASAAVALVMSRDRRRAIRLVQWVTAAAVYVCCGALMAFGIDGGWMTVGRLLAWCLFIAVGLATAYVALRSGWSERLRDPALTEWQIAMGILAVDWGYVICGPMRTVALLPLLVIFAFGAFALRWRQIAVLTTFALASLGGVAAYLVVDPPPWRDVPPSAALPVDLINFLLVLITLPALAVIAARLSTLRSTLRAQRRQLSDALAEVQRLATTDELTGLPNRRWMIERLAQEQQRSNAEGAPFCVAIIDLDHFKRINDRLGHARGDAVLREFTRRARSVLPARDTLARWGGEEFLLLMPGIRIDEARIRMDYLLQSIRQAAIDGVAVTFSAGVAAHCTGSEALEDVLLADQRMYAAKQQGRDRVRSDD
ncbi:GGDEF domain-containing protein [Lysobacter xanthus]